MPEPDFDLPKAHRWFAIEMNNRAWDLVETTERTPDETDEMIEAAYAAAIHWRHVGTPLNSLRAECLLATACACAGKAEAAIHHAEKCLRSSYEVGDEQSDFDRASVYGAAAKSYACGGNREKAREHYERASHYVPLLSDTADQKAWEKLYSAS
jgi:tetratricopeptide (TPR) repeat protein